MKIEKTYRRLFEEGAFKGVPSVVTIASKEPKNDYMIITGVATVQGQEILFRFLKKVSVKNADFLLREVSRKTGDGEDGAIYEPVWKHTMVTIEKSLNRLADINGQLTVVVTTRDKYRDVVRMVYPVAGILTATPITTDETGVSFFGPDINSGVTLGLKKLIAREYGINYEKTAAEKMYADTSAQFEQEDDEEKRKAKARARAELRKTFMERPTRTVYHVATERPLYGRALEDGENWSVLDDNTPVIITKDGAPIKFFFVSKQKGGKVGERGTQTGLVWERPRPAETANAFKVASFTVVRISPTQAEFLAKKGIKVDPSKAMEVAVVNKSDLPRMRAKFNSNAVFQLLGKDSKSLVCTCAGSVFTLPA